MFQSPKRRIIAIIALLLAFTTGTTLFSVPKYEITYSTDHFQASCPSGKCLSIYTLRIGNTGREAQPVAVSLNREILSEAVLPPTVLRFGKIKHEAVVTEEEDDMLFELTPIEPTKVVEISFTLQHSADEPPTNWDQILEQIQPTHGKAVAGYPEGTRFARFLYAVFQL